MSRLPKSDSSKHSPLAALLFAVVLAAAACSGSSDVEVEDVSAGVDDEAASEVEATEDDDATAENDAEGDATGEDDVVSEDGAMGEDDAMVEDDVDDVDTTIAGESEQAPGGASANADIESAELAAAFAAAQGDRFGLPYMYVTVDQDCSGCAETMSLYYRPSEGNPSTLTLETAFIDGVAQSDFSAVDPSLQAGDPRQIAELLDGTDAQYGIDPVSGVVASWTIDGDSVTMRCVQVDTRPIDMRTELCENSVIG